MIWGVTVRPEKQKTKNTKQKTQNKKKQRQTEIKKENTHKATLLF